MRLLKPGKDRYGYLYINLYKNDKKHFRTVHRLVLENFNPVENMDKLQCNHIDGNKENNRLENLEWCTKSENEKHAFKIGLKYYSKKWKEKISEKLKDKYKGENHPRSKLTEKGIVKIKILLEEGNLTQKEIAEKFGISQTTISDIKTGKRWKHIKLEK